MSLVVPQRSQAHLLELIFGQKQPEDLWVRLYINDWKPQDGDTTEQYTEMVGHHGYTPRRLAKEQWFIEPGETPDSARALGDTVEWVFPRGGETKVYGYYITGVHTGRLYWAERFPDGPYRIEFEHDRIRVLPKIVTKRLREDI